MSGVPPSILEAAIRIFDPVNRVDGGVVDRGVSKESATPRFFREIANARKCDGPVVITELQHCCRLQLMDTDVLIGYDGSPFSGPLFLSPNAIYVVKNWSCLNRTLEAMRWWKEQNPVFETFADAALSRAKRKRDCEQEGRSAREKPHLLKFKERVTAAQLRTEVTEDRRVLEKVLNALVRQDRRVGLVESCAGLSNHELRSQVEGHPFFLLPGSEAHTSLASPAELR